MVLLCADVHPQEAVTKIDYAVGFIGEDWGALIEAVAALVTIRALRRTEVLLEAVYGDGGDFDVQIDPAEKRSEIRWR